MITLPLKQNPEILLIATRHLPVAMREGVEALCAFASGAYAMATLSRLAPARRRKELLALEEALIVGKQENLPEFAIPYAQLAQLHRPLLRHGRDLLAAFAQDTAKSRYRDYTELCDYYRLTALPIGRAYLHLCGQAEVDASLLEPFCTALMLLLHIRNCSEDYVNRGIVYLPLAWFAFAGADVRELAADACSKELRAVLNDGIENCEKLLAKSAKLPQTLLGGEVKRHVAWVHMLAQKFCEKLHKRDPLHSRVRIGRLAMMLTYMKTKFKQ